MVGYVELHAHSAYSFLDGASMPDELVDAAVRLGHRALALTDHDGVYGAMEFAQASAGVGLRAIQGAQITVHVAPRPGPPRPDRAGRRLRLGGVLATPVPEELRHLTLLVRDRSGWASLCRLLTLGHAHTRENPRRERGQPWVTIGDVCEHHTGLVCLSGCARHGVEEEATLRVLRDAFGVENLYVELQRALVQGDRERLARQVRLARRLGLRTVATGNVHAHVRARARLQDAFVAIREHATLDASEPLRRGNHAHALTTPAAMAARMSAWPEAVAETVRLAERLEFDLLERGPGHRYPGQADERAPRRLAAVANAAFERRYAPGHTHRGEASTRLARELALIDRLGLSGFFLLHHEVLELARAVAVEVRGPSAARALLPPGRGRGSSVSSIVCYLTGLSHVDPIATGLSLDRFLHDDVAALPDIDLDFPRDVREQLLVRVHDRYGRDRAALVAAFPTYRARVAIRELGAALGLPNGELERLARASEGDVDTVERELVDRLGPDALTGQGGRPSRWGWLARLARDVGGLPRHLAQHPGGMIIATQPLIEIVPTVPSATPGRQMVQWDKDSCADAGFLKIDLLGLGMLSAVERTVQLVADRHDTILDLSRIPVDDPPTWAAIQQAETTGVFQIESRAQMGSLRRTRPSTMAELAIQVAIVRPGPVQGGAVNRYIERKQRQRADPAYEILYEHPSLRGPLEETLGTIVFQDQVISVATAFAGFSPSEAEGLRRAMSRKRSREAIDAHRDRFVAGAIATHDDVDEALAERVWAMVSGFAGFGFPKAHAHAFGILAYQSTWLRVHYPAELLCSLLNEQPMGFYPPDALVHEAQRRGLTVLAPDVVHSGPECTLTADGAVRIGLGYVSGVRADHIAALVAERDERGPWRSLTNLAARAGAMADTLERLAWAGACDTLAAHDGIPAPRRRRGALWALGALTSQTGQDERQLRLEIPTAIPTLGGLSAWDRMLADYAATGLTTGPHPLALVRGQLDNAHTSAQLARQRHRSRVRVAGLVLARQRPQTANGVTFVLLEDEHGTINLIIPPPVYERCRLAIRTAPLVIADGQLERHPAGGGQTNILVRHIDALHPAAAAAVVTPLRPDADTVLAPAVPKFTPEVAAHFGRGRRR